MMPRIASAVIDGQAAHCLTVDVRGALSERGVDNLIPSARAWLREVVDWYQGRDDVERVLMRLRRWMRGD